MKTNTLNILDAALEKLSLMTPEEVKDRSDKLGIVIPEEPKLNDYLNHLTFDFHTLFEEFLHSRMPHKWFNIWQKERINISIIEEIEPLNVALSF